MKTPRPKWRGGFRKRVIMEQGKKCTHCGERIKPEGSELHHDYRGEGWAEINQKCDEILPALGFDEETIRAFKKEQYHHRESVEALHPKCHIEADRAMIEGRVNQEKRRRA